MLQEAITLVLLAGLLPQAAATFSCPTVNATGFRPTCCIGIDGQVGTACIPAMQFGVENPTWGCNVGPPYNRQGCCQSINYTNPTTNMNIYLCSLYTGP